MTSAESIVYGSHDVESSAQYNQFAQQPSNKKEPRCGTKAKFIAAGLTLVALTLGGLGYYYGTRSKKIDSTKPNYTYKRFVNQNQTMVSSGHEFNPRKLYEM